MLRFARIYFVFCCCLRKQTAGPWPTARQSGALLVLPCVSRARRSALPSLPQSRTIPLSPPSLPPRPAHRRRPIIPTPERELFSLFISNRGNDAPKPISSEAPRDRRPREDDDDANDDDDDRAAVRFHTLPFPSSPSSPLPLCISRTHTHTYIRGLMYIGREYHL